MRNTPLLKAVTKILYEQASPLSVPKLMLRLEDHNLKPNKTSLYRQLEKMIDKGLVESLLLNDSVAFYELKRHHHHHFVCEGCESIECLADESLEEKIHALEQELEIKGLKIKTHQFSFSGLCAQCC